MSSIAIVMVCEVGQWQIETNDTKEKTVVKSH